jgi:hypothetical protein
MNQEIMKFIKTRIEEDLARFREGNPILVINNPVLEYIFLNQMYTSIIKMEKELLEQNPNQEGEGNSTQKEL